MNSSLLTQLNSVAKFANGSKWSRFLSNPIKYCIAISSRFIHQKEGKLYNTKTFWGQAFTVQLPASTDIYLSGGKTHESELRLCRYLIKHIQPEDILIDIGAHFGFFTSLFSLLAPAGKIFSFEASKKNYALLQQNVQSLNNVTIHHQAMSKDDTPMYFYEFPVVYSEYNSMNKTQYEKETWYATNKPIEIKVDSTTLDLFYTSQNIIPRFIKMDVEGGEYDVIQGGIHLFKNQDVILAMEYLENSRGNENHRLAAELLMQLGYQSFAINQEGELEFIRSIDAYLQKNNFESDNIIFKK